ncbi:transcriptional regulator, CdaR family [Amycolatopsis marina]|uniref:Transcriptional regulator, CdaR family n=1 Tax=Amycolatopsis marina TaxID=490629 RepID=A0A1I0VBH0_9PSEU|nr:PucR family transcriptional regulator [Amycolatopsis marina]SFA73675.1 transcriptional regulator, CdaR family [Amycolatopsis marina]
MPDSPREDAPTLRGLLVAIGEPLVDLYVANAWLDAQVRDVTILDPDDELGSYSGELVLIIGARGREAVRFVRAAARRGAVAAAVKVDAQVGPETQGGLHELRAAASEAGIALLAVRPRVRWEQLETLVREVLDAAALSAGLGSEGGTGDLFALAQTVAVLTAGSVIIEDAGNRVLAYSRSDDEVDELRRLSILGWEGPESYLAMLREWGVYQRLRDGEVVHIDEHPEVGIRRRLAVGIRAGAQYLGMIWVQQGREPFAERAESALLGASRVAAAHLLRYRAGSSPGNRSQQELVSGLLDGRSSPDLVAGHLGLDPATPAVVAAVTAPAEPDHSARELHKAEMLNVVSVHATAYRRSALVGAIGTRVYAVLPGVPLGAVEPALVTLAEDITAVLRRRTGASVQVGIGAPVLGLGKVVRSRSEADRVLEVMARDPQRSVATIAELRGEVLLGEVLTLLEAAEDLRDPGVSALVEHDRAHGTELVVSLLAFLDALGDVRSAANALHVHPNTLRHRVRRAGSISGIDLTEPRERQFCHLQLLLVVTRAEQGNHAQ